MALVKREKPPDARARNWYGAFETSAVAPALSLQTNVPFCWAFAPVPAAKLPNPFAALDFPPGTVANSPPFQIGAVILFPYPPPITA